MHFRHVGCRIAATLAAPTLAALTLSALTFAGSPPVGASTTNIHNIGAYRVDVTATIFVDRSRSTPANGTYGGSPSRTLPVELFIPQRRDGSSARFPLVVFAPGFGASPSDYASLLEQWASAGYVVAAIDFPLTSTGAPGGPDLYDTVHQPGDVRFVIAQMLLLDQERGTAVDGLLNPERVAVAGHSLGAVTTLALVGNSCCRDTDPRITAAIVLSGFELPFPEHGSWFPPARSHRYPAFLEINGTSDALVKVPEAEQMFAQTPAPKYQAMMLGAPHVDFGGRWGPVIDRTVVAFLNAFVAKSGSTSAILKSAHDPGVSTGGT